MRITLRLFIISFILVAGLPQLAATAQPLQTPAGTFDLQKFIDGKLAEGKREVVIPPGRYRVVPQKGQHLIFKNLHDVTIVAKNVEMICTETTRAVTIQDCTNLTLRGLAIDYDPLPFTQGRITSLSADKSTHEIELFKGYPEASTAILFKYEIFRPDTRTLRTHDYGIKSLEKVDSTHIRITKNGGNSKDLEEVGDIVVIGNEYSPGGHVSHAVNLERSSNVRLEDIDLYASNCFGFLETNCNANTYLRCHIDRCPPEKDLYPRESARVRSLNADAYHSKFAVKGPALIESSAHFMADDAVNICGAYHLVTEGSGDTYRILRKEEGDPFFKEGDSLELFTYEGIRLPDAKVIRIVQEGEGFTEKEKEFIASQRMDNGLKTHWKPRAYRVTFDHPVALIWFSVAASTQAIGNGFAVKNCSFGHNRSRGILIKASNGEISGNTVEESWMQGISISPEYWWLEAGCSNNLVIRGNTIRDVRATAINVDALAGNGKPAPSGAHHDIVIAGNKITGCPAPQIRATSTVGLRIENNQVLPFAGPEDKKPSVLTLNCEPAPGGR